MKKTHRMKGRRARRSSLLVAAAAMHLGLSVRGAQTDTVQVQVALAASDLPSEIRQPVSWQLEAGLEIVVAVASGHVLFRSADSKDESWNVCPVPFNRPHAVKQFPNGWWCVADTGNHRLVFLKHLTDNEAILVRKTIGGEALHSPHDLLWVEPEEMCYVLGSNGQLFRLPSPHGRGEFLALKAPRGYSRALSWMDGAVHVIVSSRGEIVRIDDFSKAIQTRRKSPGKRKVAPTGTWESTGLILNDVVEFAGWYWGTNHFSALAGLPGDPNRGRLLRWRTWSDFEEGKWEDLSAAIPGSIVPYFLFGSEGALYFAGFDRTNPSQDGIFRITTSPRTVPRRQKRRIRQKVQ